MNTENQYRLLNIGEEILPTDEFLLSSLPKWDTCELHAGAILDDNHVMHRRLIESPWIRYEDRKPTRDDGDEDGWITAGGINRVTGKEVTAKTLWSTEVADGWTHFLPAQKIPPLPRPKRDFQKEFVDNLGAVALYMFGLLSPIEQAKVKAKWEEENL